MRRRVHSACNGDGVRHTVDAPCAALEGNGAGLVRELELARKVQRALERLYAVAPLDDVREYVQPARNGREELLVRETRGVLEIAVHLPELAKSEPLDVDGWCQVIEGVSHFVLLADRAREDRSVSRLELELQAEVDKFVVLFSAMQMPSLANGERLMHRLYDSVQFAHAEDTELGARYRQANGVARRWVARTGLRFASPLDVGGFRAALRAFFRAPLEEKMHRALAA